eukprot:GILJ01022272.1.p2 GENE.GILJ01022272.1~~GILJ01022272.1.p2  ORF type:complete len:242 (-),score=29.03 GILJ01022272.1:243-968(-)
MITSFFAAVNKNTDSQTEEKRRVHVSLVDNSWMEWESQVLPLTPVQFEELWSLHPQERKTQRFGGREVPVPRWHQTYGRNYGFGGQLHEALETPELLIPYQALAQRESGKECNQVLVNWYDGGNDSIARHADKESVLDPTAPIYSFSYGETRTFRISKQHPTTTPTASSTPSSLFLDSTAKVAADLQLMGVKFNKSTMDIPLHDATLLVMGGDFQQVFHHEVPKERQLDGRRINITIRSFK